MDSIGSPSKRAETLDSFLRWLFSMTLRSLRGRAAGVALALAVSGLLAACSAPPFSMGYPARTSGLKNLVSQKSTVSEVIAALGEPRGYGMMRHSPDQPLRRVLVYEYYRVKDDQISGNVLLVYFDKARYDGHLWFSAKELTTWNAP